MLKKNWQLSELTKKDFGYGYFSGKILMSFKRENGFLFFSYYGDLGTLVLVCLRYYFIKLSKEI